MLWTSGRIIMLAIFGIISVIALFFIGKKVFKVIKNVKLSS